MRFAFRAAALAMVMVTGPVLATSATAAAASRAPGRAPASSRGAPHAQPPGGTQLWRAAYTLGFGGGAVAVAVSQDSSTVFVTGSVTGPKGHNRIATVAYQAATGAQLWVASYQGPINTDSAPNALAVSPDGATVFVTGRTLPRHGVTTGVTLAYHAATGANAWTELTPGAFFAASLAVSPDGSAVYSAGTDGTAMTTIAYSAASGATLWSQDYKNPQDGGGNAAAVAVSPDGATVFVAGRVTAAAGDDEYATVAYQATTGTMRWVRLQNGTNGSFGNDSGATALRLSPDGATVFVTGLLTTAAGAAYGTIAYTAATGTKLWLKRYESQSVSVLNDFAAALAVSPDGSMVVVTGDANNKYGTVAYAASTGTVRWARLYGPGTSFASSVAVSPDGSTVFVTGTSGAPHTSSQYATLAYAAATGNRVWLQRYPGASSPGGLGQAQSLTVSPDGSAVFVTGLVQDPTNQPSEYTTIAYSP